MAAIQQRMKLSHYGTGFSKSEQSWHAATAPILSRYRNGKLQWSESCDAGWLVEKSVGCLRGIDECWDA
jgi:hypothetical protein